MDKKEVEEVLKSFVIAVIIAMLCVCMGCVAESNTTVLPVTDEKISIEPTENNKIFHCEITSILNQEYMGAEESLIQFEFSRPVFSGDSAIEEIICLAFDKEEIQYRSDMQKIIEEYGLFACNDIRYFTKLAEIAYEDERFISFVLNEKQYMGGVLNTSKMGHSFDKIEGRELRVGDFLHKDDENLQDFLLDRFTEWYEETYKEALTDNEIINSVKEQSNQNAIFYISDDGIHVFYQPYTVSAFLDGVDILIDWESITVE